LAIAELLGLFFLFSPSALTPANVFAVQSRQVKDPAPGSLEEGTVKTIRWILYLEVVMEYLVGEA